ncbi:hypothetical protein AAHC03_04912 [Spirometra sp. Aus1]|nr:unnamed protein product [Spirometra erinaceieuropaei]
MVSRQLLRPVITDVIYKDMHFIIMDSPTKDTAENFAQECANLHVSDLIRVCEDKYPTVAFEKRGISVHHWEFDDGSPPPESVLDQWFDLLRLRFYNGSTNNHHRDHPVTDGDKRSAVPCPVAVHCLAGYGRAPVLVTVALLELGMANQDAIELIRSKRKGAFNDRQLAYLVNYHARGRLRRDARRCRIL